MSVKTLLLSITLLLVLTASVSAVVNVKVYLKDGTVYEQVSVKYIQKLDEIKISNHFPVLQIKSNLVDRIENRKGENITNLVLGIEEESSDQGDANGSGFSEKWDTELIGLKPVEVKEPRKKTWNVMFGLNADFGAPVYKVYQGWDLGVGFGADVRFSITPGFAIRLGWLKNGMNVKGYAAKYFEYNNESYFVYGEQEVIVGKFQISFEYHREYSKLFKSNPYYLLVGFGVIYEKASTNYRLYLVDELVLDEDESKMPGHFFISLGGGSIRKISNNFGLNFETSFDIIYLDQISSSQTLFIKRFGVVLNLNAGIVYYFNIKQ